MSSAHCADPAPIPRPPARDRTPRVVVTGNPNAGKSTLFNAITGASAVVGNFPGTTVATTHGQAAIDGIGQVEFVDVPGTFSLAADSPDERVAIDALLGITEGRLPDLVLVVADAPRLPRSLYLVLQVLELGVPAVLAVNLLDEAEAQGLHLRLDALARALGVPVVGTVARSRRGLPELREVVGRALAEPAVPRPVHGWSEALEEDVARVAAALPPTLAALGHSLALARWVLLSADAQGRVPALGDVAVPEVVAVRAGAREAGRDLDAELVGTRYAWIDARAGQFFSTAPHPALGARASATERIDRVVLHPVLGPALFVLVMGLAFTALFSWADPVVGLVEQAVGLLGALVAMGFDAAGAEAMPWLAVVRDLVVDGVIGGVGAVIVFLPQIALLFLFLALLEDCGYLARAAHLADRVLRAAGLPGRAFVPLLSGYACAVPAILATRTMPRFRDRLLTMLVIPLTSCSARLPVYILMIGALFPATVAGVIPLRPLALAGMYVLSTALAVAASVVLGNTILRHQEDSVLLELPPYRVPDPWVVLRVVWARCVDFLREAGRLILLATVVIWALLYFPRSTPEEVLPPEVVASTPAEELDALAAPLVLERSFAGRLGHAIEPAIAPLGFDWRMGIGLLGAFAAREVFVTTLGVVYGVGDDVNEDSVSLRDRLRADRRPDGTRTYTPLVGATLMVFFAISLQCTSTIAVLRKESGGWAWPAFAFGWTLGLAWLAAFLVHQGGKLLGL